MFNSQKIAFLHAHPDDESIFTGGTIAQLSQAGHHVGLIVATKSSDGQVRQRETYEAAEILGITDVHFLEFPDSGVDQATATQDAFCNVDTKVAAAKVASIIADFDALVIYDEGGIYPHPDHLKCRAVGKAAFDMSIVDALYEVTVDREYLHFVQTHVVQAASLDIFNHQNVGMESVMIDIVVDARAVLEKKYRAMLAHKSQIDSETFSHMSREPDGAFEQVYGFEWFVRKFGKCAIDSLTRV